VVDVGVVQARGGKAPACAQTGRLRSVANAATACSGRRPAPPGLGRHGL